MDVRAGRVVELRFSLSDDAGRVLDASPPGAPLAYLHVPGQLVPGLMRALEGRAPGEALRVRLEPGDAYGELRGPGPQLLTRADFPAGVELQPGQQFGGWDTEGNRFPVWITRVDGDAVEIDVNHPLAGLALTFEVEVLSVRDADPEELAHGHAHRGAGCGGGGSQR